MGHARNVANRYRQRENSAELRKERVAYYVIRGYSIRAICEKLSEEGITNTHRNEPWSRQAVHSDIKELKEEWRDKAFQTIDEHKSRIMAELGEVKHASWKKNNVYGVLKAIEQERAVIGADAPKKTELTGRDGAALQLETDLSIKQYDASKLSLDKLEKFYALKAELDAILGEAEVAVAS